MGLGHYLEAGSDRCDDERGGSFAEHVWVVLEGGGGFEGKKVGSGIGGGQRVRFDPGLYIIDGGGLMEEWAKGDIRCGLFVLHWVGFGFRECILE